MAADLQIRVTSCLSTWPVQKLYDYWTPTAIVRQRPAGQGGRVTRKQGDKVTRRQGDPGTRGWGHLQAPGRHWSFSSPTTLTIGFVLQAARAEPRKTAQNRAFPCKTAQNLLHAGKKPPSQPPSEAADSSGSQLRPATGYWPLVFDSQRQEGTKRTQKHEDQRSEVRFTTEARRAQRAVGGLNTFSATNN